MRQEPVFLLQRGSAASAGCAESTLFPGRAGMQQRPSENLFVDPGPGPWAQGTIPGGRERQHSVHTRLSAPGTSREEAAQLRGSASA